MESGGNLREESRWIRYSSGALLLLALILPPRRTAEALTGSDVTTLAQLVSGMWLFKLSLLVNAVVLWLVGRWRLAEPAARPRPATSGKAGAWPLAAVSILLVGAAVARFHELQSGLWLDEIVTLVKYVEVPFSQTILTFDTQNQHLLYSVSAKITTTLLGYSAWALRFPAALFGVAGVAAVYWFARPLVRVSEALAASALLAVSYHHVWFSQNARGYTALLLWTVVGTGLFLRLLSDERAGRGMAAGYGVAMALAIYTHLTALTVVAAHALVWLVLRVRSRERPTGYGLRMAGAALLAALSLSSLFYAMIGPQLARTLLSPAMEATDIVWTSPAWMVLEAIGGLRTGAPGGDVGLIVGILVVAFGLVSFTRQSPTFITLLLLPSILLFLLLVMFSHNLWPRFFFFAAGFGVLIVTRGLFTCSRWLVPKYGNQAGALAASVLVLGSAATVPAAWGPKQDFQGAADYVESEVGPDDAIVTVDVAQLPLVTYLGKPWPVAEDAEALARIEAAHARTWLLYTFPIHLRAAKPDIWERLETDYRRVAEFPGTVRDGAVIVVVRERTPG